MHKMSFLTHVVLTAELARDQANWLHLSCESQQPLASDEHVPGRSSDHQPTGWFPVGTGALLRVSVCIMHGGGLLTSAKTQTLNPRAGK